MSTPAQPHFLPTPDFVAISANQLTSGQLQASQVSGDSVACVYGAPGAGKSVALQVLFENLAQGVRPESILVFAATRDAAATMRDQLALRMQTATEGPLARTISSFAYSIIRYHALVSAQPLPELISGSEQDSMLAEILTANVKSGISKHWPEHITELTLELKGFRAELRDLIAVCQENNMAAADLAAAGVAQGKPEWQAAAEIFALYEAKLELPENAHRFDAPRLLNRATELLAGNSVERLVAEYTTVLVDDAHELTPSAERLLTALVTARSAGLVLFGDPDVATLGFRASDPFIMKRLADQVAAARKQAASVLFLDELPTYRAPEILNVMRKVTGAISTEGAGRQRRAVAVASGVEPVALPEPEQQDVEAPDNFTAKVFKDAGGEIAWLARTLREQHLYWNVAYEKMAVVARSRAELESLEIALAAESVPVRVVGAQTALRDEFAVNQLLKLLDLAYKPNEGFTIEDAVYVLRSIYCGLDSLGLRRLRRALRAQATTGLDELAEAKNSDELLLELFENPNGLTTLDLSEAKSVRQFLKVFNMVREQAAEGKKTIEDLLWLIWSTSGVEPSWSSQARGIGEIAVQANRNLDAVVALFASANRYVERNPGGSAREFITKQLEQALPEDSLTLSGRGQRSVALLTPSGLIGRRYDVVALPRLSEGVWPNLSPRSSLLAANLLAQLKSPKFGQSAQAQSAQSSELADELRMFYKAIGAAERIVLITSADLEDTQVSQFLNLVAGEIPNAESYHTAGLNLRSMAGELRRKLAVETDRYVQEQLAEELAVLAKNGVPGADPKSWYGLAPTSTEEPLFSVSTKPQGEWTKDDRFYIRPSHIDSFIKCPLHWFLSTHGGGDKPFEASLGTLIHEAIKLIHEPDVEAIWQGVHSKWNTLNFEAEWQNRMAQDKALNIIKNIVQYVNQLESEGTKVLARERHFDFNLGAAHVVGQIDRIEQLADGRVRVVDLKTQSGVPKAEEVAANPQLGMYQLAFIHDGFVGQVDIPENAELASADLLIAGADHEKKGHQIARQGSLTDLANVAERQKFEDLLKEMVEQMAMPNLNTDGDEPRRYFVANLSSHCQNSQERYHTCSLHLVQAVSHVD